MAFIHEGSCECAKSELDLFSVPPTQVSVDSGMFVEYHPISSLTDGAPIEFEVSSSGDDYIDFANSYLYVRAKITRANGIMAIIWKMTIQWVQSTTFYTVCFHKLIYH
jgi:hypothetical protein